MKNQEKISQQQSIERTIKLLNHLGLTLKSMSVTEISNFLGISRSTAYAMLNVLTQYNYLARDKTTKKYYLGYQIFLMGGMARHRYRELLACDEYLCTFVDQLQLAINTLNITTLEPDYQIVYFLSKTPSATVDGRYNASFSWQRRTYPSYCTACGKMLLSALDREEQKAALAAQELRAYTSATVTDPEIILQQIEEAGKQGYCIDIEGYSNFEVNIATQIRNQTGKTVAALNISVSKLIYQNRPQDYIQLAMALGKELSDIMGYKDELLADHRYT